ncbi:hypothetical protein ATANTOWER_026402 [Ataeniobius toweri]|uniref:Uncharacterized protein n=1 Tax=Ataeniobius toweri TaxID=208326 RepID=A0ABU7AS51_9TELE|nr:hypothetical protein [Ataeniobius toweri]
MYFLESLPDLKCIIFAQLSKRLAKAVMDARHDPPSWCSSRTGRPSVNKQLHYSDDSGRGTVMCITLRVRLVSVFR